MLHDSSMKSFCSSLSIPQEQPWFLSVGGDLTNSQTPSSDEI